MSIGRPVGTPLGRTLYSEVVDWALRRGQYKATDLLRTRGGIYWRNQGFHVPGVVAQIVGMVASCLWIDSGAFVGPFSSRTSGSDFSFFMGLVFGGLAYWLLARRSVRAEVEAGSVQSSPAL